MNAVLGHVGVLLGFAAAVTGSVVLVVGLVRHRPATVRNAQLYGPLVLLGALLATFAMERGLVTHDFSLAYVADNNSRETPLLYSITGMWSALQGSILLWALVLAGYTAAMLWRFRRRAAEPLVGWATLVMYATEIFFFGVMLGPSDPFQKVVGAIPADGTGPSSLLQNNLLVAFHPPMLYLGFVGFTVPFAFAVASLVTGEIQESWQSEIRRWTLFAWGFLSVGIVLGAWWSYQVLGWGGFWAWDPVENAAFMPWLVGTAYLHSVMVQERRGLLRVWNLSLVIATFSLTILGTFLTRSGVVESVHSFSGSSMGPLLIGFFALVLVVGVGLIAWRGDRLRSVGTVDSPLSREGVFLVNNLLFVGFAFVVLLGTVFPLLYEALRNQQVTVAAPYFDTMSVPVGLGLLFFMAVAPALPWRKTTWAVLRRRLVVPAWAGGLVLAACVLAGIRGLAPLAAFGLGSFAAASAGRSLVLSVRQAAQRRAGWWRGLVGRANGGMVVHLGVVSIAIGLAAATSFGHRGELVLKPGQRATFDGHTVTYLGLKQVTTPGAVATDVMLLVDRNASFHPAVTQFNGSDSDAVGTPAVDSGIFDDTYLTVDDLPTTAGGAVTVGVVVQPLVVWLWVGGALLAAGCFLAAVPGRRRDPLSPVSEPVPAVAERSRDPIRLGAPS